MNSFSRRHILFYSNHLRGPLGAAGARSWHQTKSLSEDHKVTVIIPAIDPVTANKVTDESYGGLDSESVDVVRIWTTKNNRTSILSRTLFFITAMFSQFFKGLTAKKPDLILSMSLPVTMLTVAMLVSKIRRIPLVVDVRDLPFETAGEIGYIKNKNLIHLLKRLENFCFRQAIFILTNSPRYKPYLIQYGVSEKNIYVAPIGYDDFPAPTSKLVEKWRQDLLDSFPVPPKTLAIYAGTMGFAFPIEEILEGARLLINKEKIGFVFLGDGQRLEFYKNFTSKYNLNAIFPGRVTKKDVHAICSAADICLYPAEQGEFSAAILGNKVFDYLGATKPIVYIGPSSAVSDVLIELKAGITCPSKDPIAFAGSIQNLTEDSELMKKLSDGAKGFRAAGYTAQVSAKILRDQILKIFEK